MHNLKENSVRLYSYPDTGYKTTDVYIHTLHHISVAANYRCMHPFMHGDRTKFFSIFSVRYLLYYKYLSCLTIYSDVSAYGHERSHLYPDYVVTAIVIQF